MKSTPTRLSIARWFDLLSYAAIAGSIGWLLLAAAEDAWDNLIHHLGSFFLGPAWWLLLPIALATASVDKRRLSRLLGSMCFLGFPPLWVSVILAYVILIVSAGLWHAGTSSSCVMAVWRHDPDLFAVAPAALITLAFALSALGAYVFRTSEPNAATLKLPAAKSYSEIVRLREWLKTDEEVDHPDSDRFGHAQIAARIARRLTKKGGSSSTALVGERGSGKSTIMRLVAHELQGEGSAVFVRVSLWPYESIEAAVRGILTLMVHELGERVNVLSVAGLAGNYASAIEGASGVHAAICRLAFTTSSPEETVKRLSGTLAAARLQMVLCVEDFDRFTGEQRTGDGTAPLASGLGPLRALLFLLDAESEITVVTASTAVSDSADLGKTARFTEYVPQISEDAVWSLIDAVRKDCLQKVIDPVLPEYRGRMRHTHPHHTNVIESIEDETLRPADAPRALARMLRTPRNLKMVLRSVLEWWTVAPGEIDVDDLLVATTLRQTVPEVFDFINQHQGPLMGGLKSPSSSKKNPHRERLEKLLDSLDLEPARRDAVNELLRFLFPALAASVEPAFNTTKTRPQSLETNYATDYWQRLLSPEDIPSDKLDQDLLRDIERWQKREPNKLMMRFDDDSSRERLLQFHRQFKPADFERLLRELCEDVAASPPKTGPFSDGIVALNRMSAWRGLDPAQLNRRILRLVAVYTNTNLEVAGDLERLYREFAKSNGAPADSAQQRVEAGLIRMARSKDSTLRFQRVLRRQTPWTFMQNAWGIERVRARALTGTPFAGWNEVAAALVRGSDTDPRTFLTAIAPLVTRESHDEGGRRTAVFDPVSIRALFAVDESRLLTNFDQWILPDDLDVSTRQLAEAIRSRQPKT